MLYKVVSTKRSMTQNCNSFHFTVSVTRSASLEVKKKTRPEREVIENLANCLLLGKAHIGVVKKFSSKEYSICTARKKPEITTNKNISARFAKPTGAPTKTDGILHIWALMNKC